MANLRRFALLILLLGIPGTLWASAPKTTRHGDVDRTSSEGGQEPSAGVGEGLATGAPAIEESDSTVSPQPVALVYTGLEATGVEPALVRAVSDFVQSRLTELGVYEVIGPSQIETLLGLGAQRQLLGCDSDAACVADIASALAAKRVMGGRMSQVGSTTILTLYLLDPAEVRVIGTADSTVRQEQGDDAMLDLVPGLLRRVVASDALVVLPPEESAPAPPTPEPKEEPVSQHVGSPVPEPAQALEPTARERVLSDPRSGLLMGVRVETRRARLHAGDEFSFEPGYVAGLHGQGGPIGMGLGAAFLSPGQAHRGLGARGELRIMPYAWRWFAPYVGASGTIAYFPDTKYCFALGEGDSPGSDESAHCALDGDLVVGVERSPLLAAPALTGGALFVWRYAAVGLDLSWGPPSRQMRLNDGELLHDAPEGVTLVGEGRKELDRVLSGFSMALSLSLRL